MMLMMLELLPRRGLELERLELEQEEALVESPLWEILHLH